MVLVPELDRNIRTALGDAVVGATSPGTLPP
jgi:hypothetical protein